MTVGLYTLEDAKAILAAHRSRSSSRDLYRGGGGIPDDWFFVKLTEDLAVATNEKNGYSQATALPVKDDRTATLDREDVTDTDYAMTITNRSKVYSAQAGEYMWVKQVRGTGEYVPIAGSTTINQTGGGVSGGGCNCQCVETSDLTVSGVATVSVWDASFGGPLIFTVTGGTATLSAGTYRLTWSPGNSDWRYTVDISDLTVLDTNGDPGTLSMTTGLMKLVMDNSNWTEFTIQIDGTVS